MGGMPGAIAKGPVLRRLDDLTKAQIKDAYDEIIKSDEDAHELVTIALKGKYGVVNGMKEANHIKQQWFGEAGSKWIWWPEHQPIKPVIHRGLLRAFKLAIEDADIADDQQPLDCYWVCAGHQFEVVCAQVKKVTNGGKTLKHPQVTVLFLTPPAPSSWYGAVYPDTENIWVIKHTSTGTGPGEDPVVDDDTQRHPDTVRTVRLKAGPFPFDTIPT